jgi:5'-3' exonuclease
MGIKSFSKFSPPSIINMKDLEGTVIAVDASVIAYQAALGAKSISTLTDPQGNSSLHISVIIAKVLNFKYNNVGQIWVFDFHEHGYTPPNKTHELEIRKNRRIAAAKRLNNFKLQKQKNKRSSVEDLFSSDEDIDENKVPLINVVNNEASASDIIDDKICAQEKQCFSMNSRIINDIKFILDSFDVPWITAHKGIEAEHLCATLTINNYANAVFSTDTDALIYGATKLVRNVKSNGKKILQSYSLQNILEINHIDISDLRKIAVILGCDHAKKTANVGPKTVLKKYKNIVLTPEQKTSVKIFETCIDLSSYDLENNNIVSIDRRNRSVDKTMPPHKKTKIDNLLIWLVDKNFNKNRVKKQIIKVYKTYK